MTRESIKKLSLAKFALMGMIGNNKSNIILDNPVEIGEGNIEIIEVCNNADMVVIRMTWSETESNMPMASLSDEVLLQVTEQIENKFFQLKGNN